MTDRIPCPWCGAKVELALGDLALLTFHCAACATTVDLAEPEPIGLALAA